MGCPSEVYIGDNLVFSICTHDPDTGHLTDADAAPIYRIYEEETAAAILTGTMTKLDDANTTGFYTELIACTAANGFEAGKSYTVYIEATVDSDTGGICYGFRADDITLSEITGASDIPATPTQYQALMLLYMMARNDSQATATERRVLNDAGTEVLDATMSDDGTVFTQGQLGDA